MNHSAVRGVPEHIAHRGDVVAAPLCGPVGLRNLFRNPVPEDREFIGELVVNPRNFLPQVRGRFIAADKLFAAGRGRENAGLQQRLCVGIQKVRRNRIVGEGLTRREAVGRVLREESGFRTAPRGA